MKTKYSEESRRIRNWPKYNQSLCNGAYNTWEVYEAINTRGVILPRVGAQASSSMGIVLSCIELPLYEIG
ncbi:MAG: hypothetical protein R3F28_05800 [Candidatus Kapaibacterium sp.]